MKIVNFMRMQNESYSAEVGHIAPDASSTEASFARMTTSFRLPAFASIAFLLFSLGCSSSDPSGTDERHSILFQDVNRFIHVHFPDGHDEADPMPVLLAFHGAQDSGFGFQQGARLDREADKHGFIVAYPTASGSNWAEGCDCIRPDLDGVDDVGFADQTIELLDDLYEIDRSRIYAAGYSQGGMFVHRLACERSETYAGFFTVGSLSVPLSLNCNPDSGVDIMMLNGTNDESVPFRGSSEGSYALKGALETYFLWGAKNGCANFRDVQTIRNGGRTTQVHLIESCMGGFRVRLDEIVNGTHEWPIGDIDAPSLLTEFFRLNR